MIGNDIVVFRKHRSQKRQQKYLDRVLTKEEQSLFTAIEEKKRSGLAWSIKEAVFKYYARTQRILFIPKYWNIVELFFSHSNPIFDNFEHKIVKKGFINLPHFTSHIKSPYGEVFSKTIYSEDFVHTIVTNEYNNFEQIHWGILEIKTSLYKDQTKAVRNFTKDQFSSVHEIVNTRALKFRSNEKSVPILYLNNNHLDYYFSFSHHLHLVAYSWI